jgi:hypothetical protein
MLREPASAELAKQALGRCGLSREQREALRAAIDHEARRKAQLLPIDPAEDARKVLDALLFAERPMPQRDLAALLGWPAGRARGALRRLAGRGEIEIVSHRSHGGAGWRLTRRGGDR